MSPLLDVRELTVDYAMPGRPVRAVDRVSFTIEPGEIVGLAGESGCGKSTAAHAILRLLKPPARITGGRILFQGNDLVTMPLRDVRSFRWRHASLVFQSAMNALNPVLCVGDQFVDMIRTHEKVSKRAARDRAANLLQLVGIERARIKSFPHELSGGMRQRVVIAMALTLQPELIIMDEPTTALDVVVQREILQQIEDLQRDFQFAVLFITHDLSLLVEFSNRIGIMYAAKLVEMAPADELFSHPKHPYTVGLMNSFPSLAAGRGRIAGIPGSPPDLANPPSGCRFHPRCTRCTPLSPIVEPALRELSPGHRVACHLYHDPHVSTTAAKNGNGVARHAGRPDAILLGDRP